MYNILNYDGSNNSKNSKDDSNAMKKQWLITMLSSEETNTSILNVIKPYM